MKRNKPNKEVFYVEKILDHRGEANKKLFLVKWCGYSDQFNSWEPATSFLNCDVLKRYEGLSNQTGTDQGEKHEMTRMERNQPKLTPISAVVDKPAGARILTRQRKPTYKRSLIEKSQSEVLQPLSVNQVASVSNRSTPESTISNIEIQNDNDSFKMRSKRRSDRPRKYPDSQNSQDSASSTATDPQSVNNEMELEEFTTLDKILNGKKLEQLNNSSNSSEDYPFELHQHNGLIGEEINKARIDQLIKEMDDALQRFDGYLIEDESHNYSLSRLILIAKRPGGMVAYCRLEHNIMRNFRFECVPLEILIAKYQEDVLEYLQEQIKMDALKEYRQKALERNKPKVNGHAHPSLNGV